MSPFQRPPLARWPEQETKRSNAQAVESGHHCHTYRDNAHRKMGLLTGSRLSLSAGYIASTVSLLGCCLSQCVPRLSSCLSLFHAPHSGNGEEQETKGWPDVAGQSGPAGPPEY